MMEAGRPAAAFPLLESAIADQTSRERVGERAPRLALMLHGELLLRRGRWYDPSAGAASVLRAYDSAVSTAQAAEAAAEEQGAVEGDETLALAGERHMFTGPSTWLEAALRELCPLNATSGLKNCYHLTMAAILARPPRFKLATQAGRWALGASARKSGAVMADDAYHIHGIQLAMCRAYPLH